MKQNAKYLTIGGICLSIVLATGCANRAPVPTSPSIAPPTIPPSPLAKAGPPSLYPPSPTVTGAAYPQITQSNIRKTICSKSWSTSSIRPPESYTTALKKKQMAAWHLSGTTADYEEDHLVPLEAGGDPRSEANLWPELWTNIVSGTDLGARTKDLVENYIHDEICFGIPNAKMSPTVKQNPPTVAVPLAVAQKIIATDWYACYLKMTAHQPCQ
jgi:hypothetical protein